jgi:TrkA domain protein
MTVYETDLPGVGKKHEVDLEDGSTLVVVTKNSGRREVFRREGDADAEKLFEVSDDLARTVGTVLEGAYFQPVPSDDIGTIIGENTSLEWATLGEDSPVVGGTLAESDLRGRTGATVIAIQRGAGTIPNPDPGTTLQAGDTLIALGTPDQCEAFDEAVAGRSTADSDED